MAYSAVSVGAASLNASSQIVKVLGLPDVRDALGREGYEPIGDTPEQFAALIKSELARYAKLVKLAGIQAN
jgi:tripartite-type tricarboxylate transporter receptor subunit TctC